MRVPEFALGSRGRCAGCGRALTVAESNTRALFPSDGPAPISDRASPERPASESSEVAEFVDPRASRPVLPRGSQCARCGKLFRGDWDRNPTEHGEICHICARLATEQGGPAVPGRIAEEPPAHPDSYFPMQPMGSPPEEEPKVPAFARNHPELFRGVVLTAGVAVMVLAAYFALFGDFSDLGVDTTDGAGPAAPAAPLPRNVVLLIWIIRGFFMLFGHFLALYLALSVFEKLPMDTLPGNILALIWPTLIAAFFGFIPFVGALFVALIFYAWFDFTFKMIVVYFVFHIFTSIIAQQGALFAAALVLSVIQ